MTDIKKNRAIVAQIFARCWSDDSYKKTFLSDPKLVLKQAGYDLGSVETVKVFENSSTVLYIAIPDNFTTEDTKKLAGYFDAKKESITEEVEVRVVKSSAKILKIVLPQKPAQLSKELDEKLLQTIGGGDFQVFSTNIHVVAELEEAAVAVDQVAEASKVATTVFGVAEFVAVFI